MSICTDNLQRVGTFFEIVFSPKFNSQVRNHKIFVLLLRSPGTKLAPVFFLRKFVMIKYFCFSEHEDFSWQNSRSIEFHINTNKVVRYTFN